MVLMSVVIFAQKNCPDKERNEMLRTKYEQTMQDISKLRIPYCQIVIITTNVKGNRLYMCMGVYAFNRLFIMPSLRSFIHSFIYPFIYSFFDLFIVLFIYSFIACE